MLQYVISFDLKVLKSFCRIQIILYIFAVVKKVLMILWYYCELNYGLDAIDVLSS